MVIPGDSTARSGFVKVHVDIPVRYKFLSKVIKVDDQLVHEGVTSHLSGAGLLLHNSMPDAKLIPNLLTGKLLLGLNILIPSRDTPIKALATVAWIEAVNERTGKTSLGLRFENMPKEDSDQIMQYVIHAQISDKTRRIR